jgi:hypothetical protein
MAQYFQGFALGPGAVKARHIDIDDDLSFNGHRLKDLGNPINNTDASRKQNIIDYAKWKVVYENTLTSNVSYIDITGLDINTDKEYHLTLIPKEENATRTFFLFVNGDYNANNYLAQGIYSQGTNMYVVNQYGAFIISGIGTAPISSFAKVIIAKDSRNYIRYKILSEKGGIHFYDMSAIHTTTDSNLTTLRIKPSNDIIEAGTYILLCKPRG